MEVKNEEMPLVTLDLDDENEPTRSLSTVLEEEADYEELSYSNPVVNPFMKELGF